jgi:uncharacterized protein (UPF0248 family)
VRLVSRWSWGKVGIVTDAVTGLMVLVIYQCLTLTEALFAEYLMIPIHELLNRIRWDEEYGDAEFIIGYYDRLEERIISVPLKSLYFDSEDHFDFELVDDEGVTHTIPLHRIRQVYRNGNLVWERKSG